MRQILVVLSMLALWTQLGSPAADDLANALTSKEKAEGWIALFDGKTLDGWESRGGAEWRVVNGAIMTDSPKGGGLFTTREFGDFVLRAEFRTTNDINSGIYLRMGPPRSPSSDAKAKKTAPRSGYELQIRDTPHPGGYNTGSLVDYVKASEAKIVSGQWNTYEVTAKGDHFVVIYNGNKVLDAHDSKFARGSIGLQWAHPELVPGRKIEFRNLKIKPL
jgi:hypothetical protein